MTTLRSVAAILNFVVLVSVLACTSAAPPEQGPPVSMAIVNATIWTGDPARAAAQALAIAADRIVAVGPNEDVRKLAGTATVIDTGGQFVAPGFIDSHIHFLDGGARLASAQLRDANTRDEFTLRIGAFAKTVPAGTWITGGDWDHQLWGGEAPRRDWIDAITPDHPVWINRLDGHMALANSAVAPPTPLEGIYAAVTRRTLDDTHPDGWVPKQKITVEETLWAYTRAGVLATFQERERA